MAGLLHWKSTSPRAIRVDKTLLQLNLTMLNLIAPKVMLLQIPQRLQSMPYVTIGPGLCNMMLPHIATQSNVAARHGLMIITAPHLWAPMTGANSPLQSAMTLIQDPGTINQRLNTCVPLVLSSTYLSLIRMRIMRRVEWNGFVKRQEAGVQQFSQNVSVSTVYTQKIMKHCKKNTNLFQPSTAGRTLSKSQEIIWVDTAG